MSDLIFEKSVPGRRGASLSERIDLVIEQVRWMASYKGERVGVGVASGPVRPNMVGCCLGRMGDWDCRCPAEDGGVEIW